MRLLGYLRSLVRAAVHQRTADAALEEELLAHVEARTNDLVQSGLTRAQAERQARIEFRRL